MDRWGGGSILMHLAIGELVIVFSNSSCRMWSLPDGATPPDLVRDPSLRSKVGLLGLTRLLKPTTLGHELEAHTSRAVGRCMRVCVCVCVALAMKTTRVSGASAKLSPSLPVLMKV